MSSSQVAILFVAKLLAILVVQTTMGSGTRTMPSRSFDARASLRVRRAEPIREVKYFHHVYGSSERVSHAAMLCDPPMWHSKSWHGGNSAQGEHMFASRTAQQQIWQHQYPRPEDCSVTSFLLYGGDGGDTHGIGSTLHYATWALAKAIQLHRILLFLPTPEGPWTQGKYCEGFRSMHDCYFEPESTCLLADALGNTSLSVVTRLNDSVPQHDERLLQCDISHYISDAPLVPPGLRDLLQGSPVPENRITFWFRAQAIAFIVRPNPRTLDQIQVRKQKQSWTRVPTGTISVHIRHGDKGSEMTLVPDADYLLKAEELLMQDSRLQRTIFLSTEDPASVQYFKHQQNWTILTLQVPRPADMSSPLDFARQIGPDEEMLNSLVNLDLALDCFAWVGTIKSNWNRLIEELRSTVRCKAQLPYIDASSGWDVSAYEW